MVSIYEKHVECFDENNKIYSDWLYIYQLLTIIEIDSAVK